MSTLDRPAILSRRLASEQQGLLNDIALWQAAVPQETTIHHHICQFEQLCLWMIGRLDELYNKRPDRWPNLDESTFKSLIISILSGKWILLRQVAQQRSGNSPYLGALDELDYFADNCYQRLRYVLQRDCELKGVSESSPLVYLGPIARLFLFDEEAPCLISAPFGAANHEDKHGRELSRQTIPHEVSHAIFEQIPGLMDELKFQTGKSLAATSDKRLGVIRSVLLNWLEEMVADMTGTALAGRAFADSATQITIMPDRMIGITDGHHPLPLLRAYIHGWVLKELDPESAVYFNERLSSLTQDYIDRPFESLPAVITVTMQEVKDELLQVVEAVWNCKLDTLHGYAIGEVLRAASEAKGPTRGKRTLPTWGEMPDKGEDIIFRLVGPGNLTSPLPGLPLYIDLICCPLKLQFCCSQTVI